MSGFTYRPRSPDAGVEVVIGDGALCRPPPASLPRSDRGVLIADEGVFRHRASDLEAFVRNLVAAPAPPLVLAGGERAKDAAHLPALWDGLRLRNLDRGSLAVVAGGGAVLDAGLFLAATWHRGVAAVAIPTTLLAQVDAGLGGKCGVNFGGAKNQVGVIRQPAAVVVDPFLLATLPDPEWRSGLGEVLKTALLAGGELLDRVRTEGAALAGGSGGLEAVIEGCLRHKAAVVAADEGDRSLRRTLNLGHTVAHVLEGLAAAAGRTLPHGLAVGAGILAEARVFLPERGMPDLIGDLLGRLGLPARIDVPWNGDLAATLAARDKKAEGGGIPVPVLEAPGRPVFRNATVGAVVAAARGAVRDAG